MYDPVKRAIHSVAEFSEITGEFFCRVIGSSSACQTEILMLEKKMKCRNDVDYRRIEALPKITAMDTADFYIHCYRQYLSCGKTVIHTKHYSGNARIANAVSALEKICRSDFPMMSESMITNLVVRSLYVIDEVFGDEQASGYQRRSPESQLSSGREKNN